jgi:hypothetical protein
MIYLTGRKAAVLPADLERHRLRFAKCLTADIGLRGLFRKAFHIIGNDDLRRASFADGLQVFQSTPQLGSSVSQTAFKCGLSRLASFFVRELLKHHGRKEPPFRPVIGGGRAN